MTDIHKVFVSYYHAEDQSYMNKFERLCKDVIVSKSIEPGDIDNYTNTERVMQIIRDEYLRDSTVLVVLIGPHTWQRKYVDWEIYSSLRHTALSPRSGLLGILLPNYPGYEKNEYYPHTIPPRLYDNLKKSNGGESFADIYKWSEKPLTVHEWINYAFSKRNSITPDLHRPRFGKNHIGEEWTD